MCDLRVVMGVSVQERDVGGSLGEGKNGGRGGEREKGRGLGMGERRIEREKEGVWNRRRGGEREREIAREGEVGRGKDKEV